MHCWATPDWQALQYRSLQADVQLFWMAALQLSQVQVEQSPSTQLLGQQE
jgi:hypothetical protein